MDWKHIIPPGFSYSVFFVSLREKDFCKDLLGDEPCGDEGSTMSSWERERREILAFS